MITLLPGIIPFLPALAGFVIPLIYLLTRKRLIAMSYTVIILFITTLLAFILALETYGIGEPIVFKAGGWPAPIGILYIVDRFTGILGFVSALVLLCISLYSVSYITDEGYPWYSVLLLGAASGILGVIYTGDMFNLFVMLEVTGVSAYALVMYYRHRAISVVSGLKYAFIGSLGTSLYLLAMGVTYSIYGTLNFVDFSLKLATYFSPLHVISYGIVLVLALWAFSIKSGVFPNHFWLPDAHPAAPTPISALLSGLVVNTGIVGLYRFIYIASWNTPPGPFSYVKEFISLTILLMGSLSAIFGALLMNIQRDIKRLIAYSTIMNLGFLFMGLGCMNASGLRATLYYIIAHSLAKSALFLSAGVFIKATGSRDIEKLSGLGLRYPVAGITLTVSTLALSGIPPLPGFLAKLLLYEALFEYNVLVAITMIVASAIGLLAYMKLLYIVVFSVPGLPVGKLNMKTANVSMSIFIVSILILGVLFLFNPQLLRIVFDAASQQVSPVNIVTYIEHVKKVIITP